MKKYIYILFVSIILMSACTSDLNQSPSNIAEASSLTEFGEVLNAAYHYQTGTATPLAIMGDFRSDNCRFDESPHDEFDDFDGGLTTMEGDFFQPFYASLYKSILSANTVIENSTDDNEIAEAKFLRALSYFKLTKVFGDVTINLSDSPSASDTSILARKPASEVYSLVINDLTDVINSSLDNSGISNNRASKLAAQALMGKVYMQKGDPGMAVSYLADVVNGGASAAGVSLETNFVDIFDNDLSSEIIFSIKLSGSVSVSDYSDDNFTVWYGGGNTKADELPINISLINDFDAAGDTVRKDLTLEIVNQYGVKYSNGADQDWIEIRLSDIVLLYAEALNENNTPASTVLPLLDPIRTRAGLGTLTNSMTSQADVRQAIANERRLELAFEGQRWFDLVRTGTVDQEMGQTINSNYYLFPIPDSEIQASGGVITQNSGY